jgi:ASC-1-like (ASCH) protein
VLLICFLAIHVWAKGKRNHVEELDINNQISDKEIDKMFQSYNLEPSAQDVIKQAILFAQAHPNEVSSWKFRVRKAAWLPVFKAGFDRKSDFGFSNRSKLGEADILYNKDEKDYGFDFKAEWNLPNLVFNKDELNITRESVRLSDLRASLVKYVSDIYFERRKLQIELKLNKNLDASNIILKNIKIQKIESELSSLTGGWFNKSLAFASRK